MSTSEQTPKQKYNTEFKRLQQQTNYTDEILPARKSAIKYRNKAGELSQLLT